MRQITAYKIHEHPDPEKVYTWIRENWHDLNDHNQIELIESLEALKDHLGANLTYSISQTPDRGEHITFTDFAMPWERKTSRVKRLERHGYWSKGESDNDQ